MHPLLAHLLRRQHSAPRNPLPGHVVRLSLPPSREAVLRGISDISQRLDSGIVIAMSRRSPPPAIPDWLARPATVADHAPSRAARPVSPAEISHGPDGVRLRIDPQDRQRVRISGSMREVCAALEALVAVQ
jgi:hypothetical protein